MKISPVMAAAPAAAGIDSQAARVQNIKAVKMNTNATPGPAGDPSLTISDTDGQAEAEVEATQPLSPQFAALAKQRRALQVKERELSDREKALTGQAAQGSTDMLARLKSEPLSVLLEAGVTYDQLTQAILADDRGANPELRALKAEVQALRDGVDKKLSDRDAQSEQAVLAEMRKEAEQLTVEGEAFELVRETKSIPMVMELIEKTYRATGEVLDVQEALQLVEDDLIEQSLKTASLSKVQSRVAPRLPPQPQQRQGMRTLTNRDTATAPMTAKQRALAAFYNQLPKK